jgi:hypothetical protein
MKFLLLLTIVLLIAAAWPPLSNGGLYDTKIAQRENSSGATDNIIIRTNKLTGEVCEMYEEIGPSHWSCN